MIVCTYNFPMPKNFLAPQISQNFALGRSPRTSTQSAAFRNQAANVGMTQRVRFVSLEPFGHTGSAVCWSEPHSMILMLTMLHLLHGCSVEMAVVVGVVRRGIGKTLITHVGDKRLDPLDRTDGRLCNPTRYIRTQNRGRDSVGGRTKPSMSFDGRWLVVVEEDSESQVTHPTQLDVNRVYLSYHLGRREQAAELAPTHDRVLDGRQASRGAEELAFAC